MRYICLKSSLFEIFVPEKAQIAFPEANDEIFSDIEINHEKCLQIFKIYIIIFALLNKESTVGNVLRQS